MIFIGFIYLLFFGEKLLPEKKDILDEFSKNTREYLVEAEIRNNSQLIGKTIEEAGLRNLKGLFLVEIIRKSFKISSVTFYSKANFLKALIIWNSIAHNTIQC